MMNNVKTDEEEKNKKRYTAIIILLLIFITMTFSFIIGLNFGRARYNNRDNKNQELIKITIPGKTKEELEKEQKEREKAEQEKKAKEQNEFTNSFTVRNGSNIWTTSSEINIYANSIFPDNTIAPGTNGTFRFLVTNDTKYATVYETGMFEENPLEVNMKYRLKKDGVYVIGNASTYIKASEFILIGNILGIGKSNVYDLEWFWEESDDLKDTAIGETGGTLTFRIDITATQQ